MAKRERLAGTSNWYFFMNDNDPESGVVHTAIAYCIRPVGADGLAPGVYGSFNGSVGNEVWQDGYFFIDFNGEPSVPEYEEIEDDNARELIHTELMRDIWSLASEDDDVFRLTEEGRQARQGADGAQEFMSAFFSPMMLRGVSRRWPLRLRF